MRSLKAMLLVLSFFLFVACDKRPFANVEIHGKIVNSKTQQPLMAKIQLWVGDQLPGSKGTTCFATAQTSSDGTFDIKSKAQWNGNTYDLVINPDSGTTHFSTRIIRQVSRNQNLDVGTIGL